jgi:hypothetical protein
MGPNIKERYISKLVLAVRPLSNGMYRWIPQVTCSILSFDMRMKRGKERSDRFARDPMGLSALFPKGNKSTPLLSTPPLLPRTPERPTSEQLSFNRGRGGSIRPLERFCNFGKALNRLFFFLSLGGIPYQANTYILV